MRKRGLRDRSNLAVKPIPLRLESPLRGPEHSRGQARAKAKSTEGNAFLCGQQLRFGLGQFQPETGELLDDSTSQFPEARLVVAEQQKIIRISQIGATALLVGNPMIHRIHIGASALPPPGFTCRDFEIGKRRDPFQRAGHPVLQPMGHDKPPVFTLLTELAAWSMDRTAAFPKSHRFTFGERIDNLTLDCIELCLEAIYLPPSAKKSPLLRLNIQLEKLRVFWRMVSEKKWISLNQLAFVISKVDEIGRMTEGWIKTLSPK